MDYRLKFKELRIDNDLSQKQVAEVCGISDATVGHWETLRRDMNIDSIKTLCKFYNVSADYIFDFTDTPKPIIKK